MLMKKVWDHTIETKEGFLLRKWKVYPLSREEREEVYKFIQEQLRKGYIRLLKLSQIALVFFVGKKDGKKRMVQDYQCLNKWTIKNNYPLPLILDIIENVSTKKVFTKLDLHWGYNNAWIKKEDEWKMVFMTLEELFELIVIFFGLTNSPITFQMMINEILWDLINTGEVASFINNVMIGIEEEKRHDKVVKEIVK